MATAVSDLRPGDRVRAGVDFTYYSVTYSVKRGALGDVVDVEGTMIGVEWDDNPHHMILPTSRHLLLKESP
jgi:hypothetical protein